MKSKDQAILVAIYILKESNNMIGRENFGAKTFNNQTVKLFEMTESICFFYGYLTI